MNTYETGGVGCVGSPPPLRFVWNGLGGRWWWVELVLFEVDPLTTATTSLPNHGKIVVCGYGSTACVIKPRETNNTPPPTHPNIVPHETKGWGAPSHFVSNSIPTESTRNEGRSAEKKNSNATVVCGTEHRPISDNQRSWVDTVHSRRLYSPRSPRRASIVATAVTMSTEPAAK